MISKAAFDLLEFNAPLLLLRYDFLWEPSPHFLRLLEESVASSSQESSSQESSTDPRRSFVVKTTIVMSDTDAFAPRGVGCASARELRRLIRLIKLSVIRLQP